MAEIDITQLRAVCHRFRWALEEFKRQHQDSLPPQTIPKLHYFPNCCCGPASSYLKLYLHERDFGEFRGFGWKATNQGCDPHNPVSQNRDHMWLEGYGLIVDITADQFEEKRSDSVIVTQDRDWHYMFEVVPTAEWRTDVDVYSTLSHLASANRGTFPLLKWWAKEAN